MTDKDKLLINVNESDLEALTTIPGIGKGLAERIITGRPYDGFEQLLQVEGVGERTLTRIRPYIIVESGRGAEPVEDVEESQSAQDQAMDKPSLIDRLESFTQNTMERFQIPTQVVWFGFVSSAISVLLSVILSLMILAGINRTLNFGRHSSVRELSAEISQMESALNTLSADLASADQRLQAVEGLSGRMATLESEFNILQEEVERAAALVDTLSDEVSTISADVDRMVEKVTLFDMFMEGLRVLMSDLFEPAETPSSP
jgi:outer membrane murein-binding lipoprotein Lpp